MRKATRPRLPSTIAAKDYWRDNPSLTPTEISELFEIPSPRAYRIRNELVKEKIMKATKRRAKTKKLTFNTQDRYDITPVVEAPEYVLHEPAEPVVTPVIGVPVSADDYQVGGNHYKDMGVPPWEVLEATLAKAEFIGFLKGNIIKYSMRQGVRGEIDSQKCKHYIIKLAEMQEKWSLA
ncbi:MAG: DUF3310 domain-containing protein [Roseimicrobium sp.]